MPTVVSQSIRDRLRAERERRAMPTLEYWACLCGAINPDKRKCLLCGTAKEGGNGQ